MSIEDDSWEEKVDEFCEKLFHKRNHVIDEIVYQFDPLHSNNKIILSCTDKDTKAHSEWNGFVADDALSTHFDTAMKSVRWLRVIDGVFQTRHLFELDENELSKCTKCGELKTYGNQKEQCPGDRQLAVVEKAGEEEDIIEADID